MAARSFSRPDPVDGIIGQWQQERPDIDVSGLAVFGRLHRGFLRYQTQLAKVFERHGISMAAFDILATLLRSGPPYRLTAGDLAAISLVSTGGITMRLDRLETAGLVVRERDPDDRRVVYARLTELGLETTNAVAKDHFANELQMLSGLSEPERKTLAQLLSKLERSLEQSAEPSA